MRRFRQVGALLALGLFVGCGGNSPTASVKGTVTLGGKAPQVEGLRIRFMAADGQPKLFAVGPDGSFTATAVSVGDNRLSLDFEAPGAPSAEERAAIARGKTKDRAKDKDDDGSPAKATSAVKNPVPERFRDAISTPKTFTVEAGKDNVLTWDVGDK
jgi:hypothetical protein